MQAQAQDDEKEMRKKEREKGLKRARTALEQERQREDCEAQLGEQVRTQNLHLGIVWHTRLACTGLRLIRISHTQKSMRTETMWWLPGSARAFAQIFYYDVRQEHGSRCARSVLMTGVNVCC